jgi:hypothetical protein
MGPIDRFFERAGMGTPPKKKSFYQKYKSVIHLLIVLGVIVGFIVGFAYVFHIPFVLSK